MSLAVRPRGVAKKYVRVVEVRQQAKRAITFAYANL